MLNTPLNQQLLIFIVEQEILTTSAEYINCIIEEDKIVGVKIHIRNNITTELTIEEINERLPS